MDNDPPPPARGSWFKRLRRALRGGAYTPAELIELLRDAERANLLDTDTLAMMEGALQVSEMQVRDIMVPRAQMIVVEETAELKEFLPIIIESGHSRFPVVDKKGHVAGILLAKDLLSFLADKTARRFIHKDVLRPAVFVPESKRLNILLREFRSSRNHLAIVVDEYGGVAGLVSIEDVIEQIVGEIADEHDITDVGFVKPHGANRYTVKARMPITEFNTYFGTDFNDADVDTIGGLVLRELGHLPKRGERLTYRGLNFLVSRADRRRIHTLRVLRPSREAEPPRLAAG
ncbi:MAG TPA: transporter associated domain-containing protein [Gammaproteobacteria bacterium]|nr:transporter associated domain-containing protein [Gammaproteobacteria bacterium]